MRQILFIILTFLTLPSVTSAQDRVWLGNARIFNNDLIGDGGDKWQSGGDTFSHLRGKALYDGTPQAFGDILEFRFSSEITAPSGSSPAPGDRPHVGSLSFGVFTHFGQDEVLYTLGADITAVGPQTGVTDFQKSFHERYDMPDIPHENNQIANGFWVSGYAEAATRVTLSELTSLRPFVAMQIGAEDLVRYGFDLRIARFGHDNLVVRDRITGHLSPATRDLVSGVALVAGADFAIVDDSRYLPRSQGYSATSTRNRVRIGLDRQFAGGSSLFYGATYLSPEFVGQPEGQIVGSLRLDFNF
jgi:hypothetical protein